MKRKFRAIALLLLVCMLFAGVTSCEFLRADLPESDTDEVTNEPQQEQGLKEVYLIRPQTVSNATKDLLVAARDYLKKETDFTVKLTSDYEEYEAKEGRFYILFGKTEYALSKELASKATDHEIRYKSTEDSVAIYAKNDQLFQIAVEKFFGDCFSEGTLVIGEEYREATIDGSDLLRENWTLGVPAYPYGKLDVKTYSAGYGLSLEKNCSYMQVANETDPEEFQNYLKLLERLGYKKEFENSIDGNLYASYIGVLGSNIYVYFMLQESKVRIVDDNVSVALSDFNYSVEANGESRFYLFRMTTTSEDTYLIHLTDNSWIVIDGGMTQFNDTDPEGVFVDDLYNFMAERSGLTEGEKLVISCWYMTHGHRDHLLGFKGMISRYNKNIELQRVLANVPDRTVVENKNEEQYRECVELIKRCYPNALYLKAHTGMRIQLADALLEVVYSQEDNLENWCADTQNLNYKIYDYNNSSLCTKITVAGISVLELGDNFCSQFLIRPYYNIETLATDILKIGHHYYNPESDAFYQALYETGKVKYALVNHWTNPVGNTGVGVVPLFGNNFIRGAEDKTFEFYASEDGITMNVITHTP